MTRTRRFFRCDSRLSPPGPGSGSAYLVIAAEVSARLLGDAYGLLRSFDAVIGPTSDGGWYAFGLREPSRAPELEPLTDSGTLMLAALRLGLRVALLPTLPVP
ncbi:DUF2064 domain-containing protein [Actinoplanes sp. NPDC051475]|uniref:DUF2064 domain-containing protein n=1 Tax=Actinoplanes sp. NPDC051475 TaxID=3157225 RepID=UPI00344F9A0B